MCVSRYLRTLRKGRGLSLKQVEREAGVSNAYLSQIERGLRKPPHPDILKRLAKVYEVFVNDLLIAAGYVEDLAQKGITREKIEQAFEHVITNPKFRYGTRLKGARLGLDAKRFIVDSFGKITNSQGSVSNPFRYTGRDFDSETGLYYYRARYFDPTTGRFLSEDPIRFKVGTSFYAYVGNDTVNLVDPTGLQQYPPKLPGAPDPGLPNVPTGKAGCRFIRQVYYGGPCKTCWYECLGYGGPVTFPQAVEKPCPSINPVSGLVNTDEVDPKCGGRQPCDKKPAPQPMPVPELKPSAPLLPIVFDILVDIPEGLLAGAGA